jgi:hypothetical protein
MKTNQEAYCVMFRCFVLNELSSEVVERYRFSGSIALSMILLVLYFDSAQIIKYGFETGLPVFGPYIE